MNWIKKFINETKEKRKKDKIFKQKVKQKALEEEKIEKEIDDELKKQIKEEKAKEKQEHKWSIRLYLKLQKEWKNLTDTEDAKELEAYMTEKELKEQRKKEKKEKIFTIGTLSTFACIIICIGIVLIIINENTKSDLQKTTIPLIKNYYKNKYNNRDKLEETSYLTYVDENNEETNSNVVLATYSSGIHVMAIDNDTLGDDGSTSSIYEEYHNFIVNSLSGITFYANSPTISYTPYIVKYNMYYDYIDVLPNGKTFNDMYTEGNLTIIDRISYEGTLDLNSVQNLMYNLGDNSAYYLFEMSGANVKKFSIVTKTNINTYDIVNNKNIIDDIYWYQLDTNLNTISNVTATKYSNMLDEENNAKYTNIKSFEINEDRRNSNEEDTRTNYYLLRLPSVKIGEEIYFMDDYNLTPLDKDDYPNVVYYETSNGAIIVTNEEITIANKEEYENTNILCKIGLC